MSNFNHGRSTYDFSRTKFSKVDLPIIPSQANPNMSGPTDADRNNLLRNYVSYIDYIKFGYLQQFGSDKYPETYIRGNENDGNGREITWASFVEILDVIVKDLYDRIYALENNQEAPTRTYTITYDANGGNTTPAQQPNISSGTTVTLASAISRNADSSYTYTFAGWVDQNTGTTYTAGQRITVTSNITLKAKWDATPISETVYHWHNGMSTPSKTSWSESEFNQTATEPITSFTVIDQGSGFNVWIVPTAWGNIVSMKVDGETRNPWQTPIPWNPTLPEGYIGYHADFSRNAEITDIVWSNSN